MTVLLSRRWLLLSGSAKTVRLTVEEIGSGMINFIINFFRGPAAWLSRLLVVFKAESGRRDNPCRYLLLLGRVAIDKGSLMPSFMLLFVMMLLCVYTVRCRNPTLKFTLVVASLANTKWCK